MNILVSYMGRRGGGAEYAYEMTKGLIENNQSVYAVISAQVDNLELWKQLPLKKLIMISTSDQYKGFFSGTVRFCFHDIFSIKKILQGVKIDILYVPMSHPWSTLTRYFLSYKHSVGTLHDPVIHPGSPFIIKLFLWIESLKPYDSLVILSKTFLEYTKKKYNKRDNEIVVIPHGAFSHYDINVKGESNPPIAKYNFLFFGRVTEYKGIDILLEAYAMLSKERDDVSLRIIGEGDFSPYRHLLANCKNCVVDNRYVGDDEVHSFFSMNNTITVIPYTSATQSGVIPIAMREQSLIINTRISGLLEQTQNGALSLCCDVSAEALYEQMLYAIDHYSDCKTKVCDAKRYIDSLSWDKLANDLSAHFCRMLN